MYHIKFDSKPIWLYLRSLVSCNCLVQLNLLQIEYTGSSKYGSYKEMFKISLFDFWSEVSQPPKEGSKLEDASSSFITFPLSTLCSIERTYLQVYLVQECALFAVPSCCDYFGSLASFMHLQRNGEKKRCMSSFPAICPRIDFGDSVHNVRYC